MAWVIWVGVLAYILAFLYCWRRCAYALLRRYNSAGHWQYRAAFWETREQSAVAGGLFMALFWPLVFLYILTPAPGSFFLAPRSERNAEKLRDAKRTVEELQREIDELKHQ